MTHSHKTQEAKEAQQIQRGLEPAETIPQLVDAVRQDVAGIGACVSSIRFIEDSRPGDVPKSILEWVDRIALHNERIDSKLSLARNANATKLYIEIDLQNDAMLTAADAGDAINRALLSQSASMLDPLNQHEVGTVRDANGNTVGKWEVR